MGPYRKDDIFTKISPHSPKISLSQYPKPKVSSWKSNWTSQASPHEVPPAPIFTASLACKTQTSAKSYKPHQPNHTCPAFPFSKWSINYQGTSTFNGCCPSPIRWLIHLSPNKVQSLFFPFFIAWPKLV